MEYPTEQAMARLEATPEAPAATPVPTEVAPVETQAVENTSVETATPVEQGTPAQADSPLDIDLSGYDPEVAARIRAGWLRQSDYTRKTQEIAPLRTFMEQAGIQELTPLQEAWQLATVLNENPQAFYERLGSHLGIQNPPLQGEVEYEEETPGFQIPPEVQRELDASRQFRQQFEEQQRMAASAQQFDTNLKRIREAHPTYKERDLDRVAAFGFATQGDLVQANDLYQEMRHEIISEYIASKAAVPTTATVPTGATTHAEIPKTIGGMDEAKRIAREMVAAWDND